MQTLQRGKTTINVQLPDGFDPEYSVDGLDVSVEGNVLTFKAPTESRAKPAFCKTWKIYPHN